MVGEPGLGNPQISTFRSLIVFDGHLYAPPAGQGVNFNSNKASVIMRSADPKVGGWEPACPPGFGDSTNNGIFQMAVFANHLYAGTFNHYQGYQIWRTPANGGGPCQWEKVMERGAYRGPLSQIAMAMHALDDCLYIGSSIQNGGYDRYNLVGPGSGEVVRLYADNSWDLLVGTPATPPTAANTRCLGTAPDSTTCLPVIPGAWRCIRAGCTAPPSTGASTCNIRIARHRPHAAWSRNSASST